MLIAKIENGQVINVSDYQSMFPDTSFPASGPTDDWMAENSCMYVNTFLTYDQNTEKLVPATPYIQVDNSKKPLQWVYTVQIEPLTPEEIEQRNENKRQQNKSQASALLSQTDWTTIPDVSDSSVSSPYLVNVANFIAYRNELRKIAVNPPIEVVEWPEKPEEIWSN